MAIFIPDDGEEIDKVAQKRKQLSALQQVAKERAKNEKGDMGSTIGSLLGAAAGLYFGGPQGMSVGSSLGGSVGKMVGEGEVDAEGLTKVGKGLASAYSMGSSDAASPKQPDFDTSQLDDLSDDEVDDWMMGNKDKVDMPSLQKYLKGRGLL